MQGFLSQSYFWIGAIPDRSISKDAPVTQESLLVGLSMIIALAVVAVVEEAVDVVIEVVTEVALSVDVKLVELVDFFGLVTMSLAHRFNPLVSFSFRSAFVFRINLLILSGFPLTFLKISRNVLYL